jgi:hypothetical protein
MVMTPETYTTFTEVEVIAAFNSAYVVTVAGVAKAPPVTPPFSLAQPVTAHWLFTEKQVKHKAAPNIQGANCFFLMRFV